MAYNEKANVTVTLNNEQARKELQELQGEYKRLYNLRKKAEQTGDVSGWKKIDQEMKKNVKTQRQLEKNYVSIENTLNNLNGASLKDLEKAQRTLTVQQKTMTRGTKEWKKELGNLNKIEAEIRKVKTEMGRIQSPMQKMKNGLKNLFASLGAFTGITAVVSIIRNAARVTAEFSKAQSNLASVLGTTKDNIRDLSQDAIKYGSLTKFTATQVSELQTEFAKLGLTSEQIKASTKAALDLAAATNAELGPAAKVTGVALKAFGLSASYANEVAATLAVSTSKSAISFEDFETILSTVGPVAKSFGFTIEDTLALTGKLKDAGFDASSAATATRNILLNLADSNGKLAQALGRPIKTLDDLVPALADLQSKGIDLNETLQLTDKRSVSAFNTFLSAKDSTIELRDGISDVTDELQNMVDTQLDNLAGDVTKLNSAWQGFVLSIENGDGVISRFARGTLQFFTDSLIKLSNIDLIFKRASKFSEDEVSRAYDAMMNLSGRKYQKFQELVQKENELTLEQTLLRRAAMIEEIKDTGQSQKEAEKLWDEFYKRRYQQDKEARELKRAEEKAQAEKEANEALLAEKKKQETEEQQLKKRLAIAKLIEADIATQKEKIKKYFAEAGEGAIEAFFAAIEKTQASKTIDFSIVPESEEEETKDPALDYAVQQYQQTLEFKKSLLDAQYANGIIAEQEYQDKLNELNRQGEKSRYDKKMEYAEKAQQLSTLGANFISSLMELELANAGDNEEKKAAIRKKYATMQFLTTSSQIIVDTAAAVMKAYAQLGPIGGPIAAAIIGATGLVQLGIANAERKKIQKYEFGKYPGLQYTGRPKTGTYGNQPHLGIFNEVPGQPEMVIDGLTLRKLNMDFPEIIASIHAVRDGRQPQMYGGGKYLDDNGINNTASSSDAQNSDIKTLQDSVVMLHHTVEILSKKKYYIAIDMVQKKLQRWEKIEATKGM
ncbi:phage tail tape measure protein [uncultured Draconibacterium sp.]|uniref:phage tail tape measure protein n=1 Tax=uncultured Draconibacterium sp. TaxID=1573823 RepID=UPI00261F1EFB|nr:phage tail tape measure protein [uncultured Draconibacterium sp.]